ncbi:hypothetical protein D3C86_1866450 [compost metagenome]
MAHQINGLKLLKAGDGKMGAGKQLPIPDADNAHACPERPLYTGRRIFKYKTCCRCHTEQPGCLQEHLRVRLRPDNAVPVYHCIKQRPDVYFVYNERSILAGRCNPRFDSA